MSGKSALWLWGIPHATDDDPVEATVPVGCKVRSRAGLLVRRATVPPQDVIVMGELRVTNAERTAWDLARGPDLVEAVVALDAMAGKRLVTREQLLARCEGNSSRARHAIEMMDGRAESPQESRVRVHLIVAGLPAPIPQFEIVHNGRLVARVDLAWPHVKVALEYDGEWHNDRDQFRKDRRRLNALTKSGWTVFFVTADTLRNLPALVVELREVLGVPV